MSLLADARSARNSKRRGGTAVAVLLSVACVAALAAAPTPAGGASPPRRYSHRTLTPTSHITVGKSDSSRIARTDRSLLREHGRQLVPVVVKFDYDALAAYRGSIQGLPATSPSVTRSKLNATTGAAQAYTRFVIGKEATVLSRIKAAVPAAQIGTRLRTVYGGAALRVPADDIAKLIATKGVVAVQRDALRKPLTDSSPQFIGAPTIWTAARRPGDRRSGRHLRRRWTPAPGRSTRRSPGPRLLPRAAAAADGHPRVCNFGDNPLTPADDPFVCNNKLIGGRAVPRHLQRRSTGRRGLPRLGTRLQRPRHAHRDHGGR